MHQFLERLQANAYTNLQVEDYTPDLQGWIQPGFNTLLEIIYEKFKNSPNLSIFEVGSWKGASAVQIAEKFRDKLDFLLCIDTWLGAPEFYTLFIDAPERFVNNNVNGWPTIFYTFTKNMKKGGLSDCVVPFPISSVQAAEVLKYYGITADIIYIDCAHEYEAVLSDLEAYKPLLKPGGVLWGDDYGHDMFPGLKQAVDLFVEKYNCTLRVEGIQYMITL